MNTQAIQVLLPHLPLRVQEGTQSIQVKRTHLQQVLEEQAQLSPDSASLLLAVLERLLCSVASLDFAALKQGEWAFVSFPAQLCALSLLRVLADERQNVLAEDFWAVSAFQHENTVDNQYAVLHWLENQRLQEHQDKQAQPVRQLAIACALVKLEDSFLLHRRESAKVRDANGDFVLIGGRTAWVDMVDLVVQLGQEAALRLLHSPADLPTTVLDKTLIREVREETGLEPERDYQFSRWQRLAPCRRLSGALANYAYSEYRFELYLLQLTHEGLFRLLAAEQAKPHLFARFSVDELLAGQRVDGKTAYIDMLRAQFAEPAALVSQLMAVPNTYSNAYAYASVQEAVILPTQVGQAAQVGLSGKEKRLDLDLSLMQCQVLALLSAHARGWRLSSCHVQVQFLAYGWLAVLDPDLRALLQNLATHLQQQGYAWLVCWSPHYFRLDIAPAQLFWHEQQFAYQLHIHKHHGILQLERKRLDTPWATIEAETITAELPVRLAQRLDEIRLGRATSCLADKKALETQVRKSLENKYALAASGLKKFLRIEMGQYQITCSIEMS